MALPIISKAVTMTDASKSIVAEIDNLKGVALIFKIEELRTHITNECTLPRQGYLNYILKMYKENYEP